jgi:hypothetical protein
MSIFCMPHPQHSPTSVGVCLGVCSCHHETTKQISRPVLHHTVYVCVYVCSVMLAWPFVPPKQNKLSPLPSVTFAAKGDTEHRRCWRFALTASHTSPPHHKQKQPTSVSPTVCGTPLVSPSVQAAPKVRCHRCVCVPQPTPD